MKTKSKNCKRDRERDKEMWLARQLAGTPELVADAERAFYRKRGLPLPMDLSGYSILRGLRG